MGVMIAVFNSCGNVPVAKEAFIMDASSPQVRRSALSSGVGIRSPGHFLFGVDFSKDFTGSVAVTDVNWSVIFSTLALKILENHSRVSGLEHALVDHHVAFSLLSAHHPFAQPKSPRDA